MEDTTLFSFDDLSSEDLARLPTYVHALIRGLRPLLAKIDTDLLDDESRILVVPLEKNPFLHIVVRPRDKTIPGLNIFASHGRCCLGLFQSEYIEANSYPNMHTVERVLQASQRYLEGITIVEHYTKRNHLIKKVDYWGINPDKTKENRAGVAFYGFPFYWRTHHTVKRTFSFLKKQ